MAVLSVTTATFQREVLQSELPVLIDLWAPGFPACRQLSPRVEEVARELEGKLKAVKVNVEENPQVAQMFRATEVPMLIVVAGGRPVNAAKGAISKAEILELVEPHLPGAEDEIPAKELPPLIKAGKVLIVDVRDTGPFQRAHIPGARNVPAESITLAAQTLAMERKPVVLYDRSGGEDVRKAFDALQQIGLPAAILKGGFLAWESEGYDIERS
ncbi:MAG: thioredoxin [Deltaproteobacteria bacterium]|jgi:thioredoxin 1|nr:thioredoxin [Deltaproteobacteria bacterium]MBP6835468.1 thioredoxin [Deltaproteobacteria bacterium]